jgi:prepilin-type processing-associated H-X9-DG protein
LGSLLLAVWARNRVHVEGERTWQADLTAFAIILSASLVVVWPLGVTLGLKARRAQLTSQCQSSIKSLLAALEMYRQDHNDAFPDSRTWCDALNPYVSGEDAFVCPAARSLRCGYAFNSTLSGLPFSRVTDSSHTIAIFESDAGWNASGGPELLAARPRHSGKDNFGFADGHVKIYWRGSSIAEEEQVWSVSGRDAESSRPD